MTFEESKDLYTTHSMGIIDIFKRYGVVVTEDLCREVFSRCCECFKVGYRAGMDDGIDHFEKSLSDKLKTLEDGKLSRLSSWRTSTQDGLSFSSCSC